VFCERLVIQDGHRAVAHEVGHLAAITAAKYYGGVTQNALAVADGLRGNKILSHISEQVCQDLIPRGIGPGRVRHGGNGKGNLTCDGLVSLLKDRHDIVVAPRLPNRTHDWIEENQRLTGEVPVSEFLISLKTAIQANHYLTNDKLVTRPLTTQEFKHSTRHNKVGRRQKHSYQELGEEVQASKLSRKNKNTVRWILARHGQSTFPKISRRLDNVIARGPGERFLPLKLCEEFIQKHSNLDWGDSLRRKFGKPEEPNPSQKVPETTVLAVVDGVGRAH
jgi:hypothetical protein